MEQSNELRQEAKKRMATQQVDVAALSPEAIQDLIYKLQVHQIELEMQNEQLQQTQQALEQAHRRYVDLYDFAPVGYLTLDPSNYIREANLTMARMMGSDRNSLLGRPFRHFLSPADQDLFYDYRRRLSPQQTFVSTELRLLRPTGGHFEAYLLGAVEKRGAEAGRTLQEGWLRLAVSDISERKRLEEEVRRHQDHLEAVVAERTVELTETNEQLRVEIIEREQIETNLRESEERFRTISELMSDYVYALRVEPEGSLITDWTTASFTRDTGYIVAGKVEPPADNGTIYQADQAILERRLERLLAGQEDVSEYRIVTESGAVRWLRDYGRPVWDEAAGRVTGVIGAAQDITGRKQAEAALQASETLFRTIFESSLNAIYILQSERDEQGHIVELRFVDINPRAEAELSLSRAELVGRGICELFPINIERGFFGQYAQVIETGRPLDQEYMVQPGYPAAGWYHHQAVPLGDGLVISNENITERKQAEAALQASEERFRAVWEIAADAMVLSDPEGIVVAANPAYFQLYGFEPEAVIGHSFAVIFPEEEREWAKENYKATFASSAPSLLSYEAVVHRADGTERIVEARIGFLSENGRRTAMLSIIRDVTEQKQAAGALAESERKYRLLAEHSYDGVALFEKDRLTYVSPGYKNIHGHPIDNLEGLNMAGIMALIHPDDRERVLSLIARQDADQLAVMKYDFRVMHREGYYVWVEDIVKKQFDAQGKPTQVIINTRNITDRKRIEERLKASEARQRAILEAIPDLIFHFNREGVFLDAQGPEDILAYSLGDHIGKNAVEVLPPELARTIIKNIEQVLTSGEVITAEYHLRRDNQDRFLESRCVAGSENEALLIIRDVTDRRQLEEQFRQSQKMEAIGQLAGGVAHHFNNLLTSIMGYVGLSLSELPANHPLAGNLRHIQTTAQRAATLTRQLLAFTRKQPSRPEIVDLNELIRNIGGMFTHLISETIALELELASNLGRVNMDAGQFEQLLVNLVVNARDAMPRGGRLVIQTTNVDIEPDQSADGLSPGAYVRLTVSDTGEGMSEAIKAHMFEPFFTTKEVGQGTGLGLSTCYGIVQQHDGHIIVDSEPGQGTTFRIYLPRVAESVSPTADQAGDNAFPAGQETILLVEDEATLRELMARVLRRMGYTVLEAEDGQKALRLIKKRELGRLDLLLTDMVMPRMDGETLAVQLQAWYRDLKVLLISGHSDKITGQTEAPAFPFLAKPFTPIQLAEQVRRILDER